MNIVMNKPIIGILGAGKLGTTLAKLSTKAGYKTLIASSKSATQIQLTISVLAPKAIALNATELKHQADIIISALPLGKYRSIEKDNLQKKIILDAMNYWWEVDGNNNIYSTKKHSSSELIQQYLPESTVIKALNHMSYHDLQEEAGQGKDGKRKSIILAGDDQTAILTAAQIVTDFGFDPLVLNSLSQGKILEPGSPLFGADDTKENLRKIVVQELKKLT